MPRLRCTAHEESFRAVKQPLRAETPQSWARLGPERTVMLALLTYGLVWLWYLLTQGDHPRDRVLHEALGSSRGVR